MWERPDIVGNRDFEAEDETTVESAVVDVMDHTEEMSLWESSEPVCIPTVEEEQRLQDGALSAAEQSSELYKDVRISYPQTNYSYIGDFADEQRKEIVKCLGEQGAVSILDDINMEKYQKVEEFSSVSLSGGDAMVTVFDVHEDRKIGALTFIHRNGKIQTYMCYSWLAGRRYTGNDERRILSF